MSESIQGQAGFLGRRKQVLKTDYVTPNSKYNPVIALDSMYSQNRRMVEYKEVNNDSALEFL